MKSFRVSKKEGSKNGNDWVCKGFGEVGTIALLSIALSAIGEECVRLVNIS